ncbi:MAG TPA: iron ABC transporter permease [Oligoflexia bacterium]|nr:iron ABC transporter permease [Oligoflexia bacterium]
MSSTTSEKAWQQTALWIVLLAATSLLSLFLGTVPIQPGRIAGIFADFSGLPHGTVFEPWEQAVIFELRLPRLVLGLVCGAALALCGAAMQAMFRNPLACPGITGVSSGAALGAVLAIFFNLSAYSPYFLPLLAFLGGLGACWAVYAISSRRGHVSVPMLLLSGVALNSINTSIIAFLLSLSFANYETGKQIIFWTLGGLDTQSWPQIKLMLPFAAVGCAIIVCSYRELDALSLGELHASSVGVDVRKVRRKLIFAAALATASTVALCGTIGFVGLIVPHIVRLIYGPHHRTLFPVCAAAGAVFLVLADIAARTLIAPEEIRLGVITAACGGPFFLLLLVSGDRRGLDA